MLNIYALYIVYMCACVDIMYVTEKFSRFFLSL